MLTYPSPEELLTLGLCQVCLNGGESAYICPDGCGPCVHGEVSCLCLEDHADCDNCCHTVHDGPCDPNDFPIYSEPLFTEQEIENALEVLNDYRS